MHNVIELTPRDHTALGRLLDDIDATPAPTTSIDGRNRPAGGATNPASIVPIHAFSTFWECHSIGRDGFRQRHNALAAMSAATFELVDMFAIDGGDPEDEHFLHADTLTQDLAPLVRTYDRVRILCHPDCVVDDSAKTFRVIGQDGETQYDIAFGQFAPVVIGGRSFEVATFFVEER